MRTANSYQGRPILFQAQAGPQEQFINSPVREVLYGGAAGGGKSFALTAAPLRWIGNENFRALMLRRETTQLFDLIDNARKIYKGAFPAVHYRGDTHLWSFPSEATIRFNHCKDEGDAFDYQGQQFSFIGFDELTHFTLTQYREIISRLRSVDSTLPRYIRATTNPGGPGHEWVFERWGAWLNPDFEAPGLPASNCRDAKGNKLPPLASGRVAWIVRDETGREIYVPKGTPDAFSRTFIKALLTDNPALMQGDPNYQRALLDNDPVRRAQLLEGDWIIKPAAGLYFKKGWFSIVDTPPAEVTGRLRYWDLAASPRGDWAVGVLVSRTANGVFWVEHVERLRGGPGDVQAAVKMTAELDGKDVPVWIEQDPGQAGKDQVHTYITTHLVGWTVYGRPKRVNKVVAAGPASSQAQAGNIRLVRGSWNTPFLAVLESFPDGDHDDDVDGLSGGVAALLSAPKPFVVPSPSLRLGSAAPSYWNNHG